MLDINKLREDVRWWTEELRMREIKVKEAVEKLRARQGELMRAEQEEARQASNKKDVQGV